MQQYVYQMHTYLNIDRVLGFPIQPTNYSSETRVSDRGVSVRLAIHHYPPVKPMIIEAPEMILELRATVDSLGRMEYQFSNYFANPTDLEALAIMDYIFYRIYSFYKKKEDIPVASAIMFVFVVQFCAILLVGVLQFFSLN